MNSKSLILSKTPAKITFLQKLLGRNYKWWFLMLFYHKRQTTYTFDNLMWILSASLRLFGSIYLWVIFSPSNSKEIFTYLFLGNLFLQLTANYTGFALGYDILSGKIANVLLYPQSLIKYHFCRSFGGSWYSSSMYLAVFLVIFVFSWKLLILPSFINLFLSFIFLVLGLIIKFLIEFLIGCLAFWVTQIQNALMAVSEFSSFLSGNFIPLYFLPLTFQFLPFAWLLHHPMQIYLGKYSPIETFWVFLGGISWCILLYFLAKLVFKMGLKRNESVGL